MKHTISTDSVVYGGPLSASSSISWNHTVGNTNTTRFLVVSYVGRGAAAVSNISYNGKYFTKAVENTINHRVEVWYLQNPDVGTYSITLNTVSSTNAFVGSISFFGVENVDNPVDQVTGTGATTASSTLTVSNTVSGCCMVSGSGTNSTNITIGASQSEIFRVVTTDAWASGYKIGMALGNNSSTYTYATNDGIGHALATFKPGEVRNGAFIYNLL